MTNDLRKAMSQLAPSDSDAGMGRIGGAAARGSTSVSPTAGGNFSAMESALLRKADPPTKGLAPGSSGRQFANLASGGEVTGAAKIAAARADGTGYKLGGVAPNPKKPSMKGKLVKVGRDGLKKNFSL